MKTIYYILILMIAAGCSTLKVGVESKSSLLQKNSVDITDFHKEAIKSIVSLMSIQQPVTRSDNRPHLLFDIVRNQDNYTFKHIPHYEFDGVEFLEDPRAGRITECLRVPENEVWFLVEAKDGGLFYMQAHRFKRDDVADFWSPSTINTDLRQALLWLEQALVEADSNQYLLFTVGYPTFFVLHVNGEPVFYDFQGKKWDPQQLCNYLIPKAENAKRVRDAMREAESKGEKWDPLHNREHGKYLIVG